MYESYYGFTAKPFQLKPDPDFFYDSKPHKRAMSYLEYGVSLGEGFIVITGEVGAGKTTLVRNLLNRLPPDRFRTAHISNTQVDADNALQMVLAGFGLPHRGCGKAELLDTLERFLQQCDVQGCRALLVVDEAQNLRASTLEELRMLSNFQNEQCSLLQTFLLGQPEFRRTLACESMLQLRQRVVASYHLGPMDPAETRGYIEHRLSRVGWSGSPAISEDAFELLHVESRGIPRRINTLCDRLFLLGYLDEIHCFGQPQVEQVIADMRAEFMEPGAAPAAPLQLAFNAEPSALHQVAASDLDRIEERVKRTERSVSSILDALRRILPSQRA